ncbi:DUF2247 family protein [Bacillus sp. JZ8]
MVAKLEGIISDSSSKVMNKEYLKWLYSIIKEVYNNAAKNDEESIFRGIEIVFSIFNTPENMYGFFRKVSDAFYYPGDSNYTIQEVVEEFLRTERQIILN